MDPKSRDSQGRGAFTGTALVAALLTASFSMGCDATSDVDVDDEDDRASQTAVIARDVTGVQRRSARALSLVSATGADARAPHALVLGAEDDDDDAIDRPGTVDDGVVDDDDDAADDDTTDEPADDAPTCADGADVTAPTAMGRIVTLPASETGMEPISPTDCVEVVDDCDAVPLVELLWVRSDEPEQGVATDDHFPDVSDLGCGLGVRAERAEGGDGRVYTIGWRASDRGGNATQGTCTILVEKDPGVAVVDSGAHYEVDLRGLGCP